MASFIRSKVSKKKKRWQKDGFDLDLSYITPRIIAMGIPSVGMEASFRNPLPDVQNFFKHYHDQHYWIYNLCIEPDRQYDAQLFDGRVTSVPFYDHNPPKIDQFFEFCEHAQKFLQEDEKNVIAVHCKAGKGRTGTMICAYLLYEQYEGIIDACVKEEDEQYHHPHCDVLLFAAVDVHLSSPTESPSHCGLGMTQTDAALKFYGDARTENGKGVTIPSQIRYIRYFEDIIRGRIPRPVAEPHIILLKSVRMFTVPKFDVGGGCDPYYRLYCNRTCHLKTQPIIKPKANAEGYVVFDIGLPVWGDVRMDFIDYDKLSKDDKMFQFWFNTNFVASSVNSDGWWIMELPEVDGGHKDVKKHEHFKADFRVELEFDLNPGDINVDTTAVVEEKQGDEVVEPEEWEEDE